MPHSVHDIDDFDEELKSKSEIKREMLKLQEFASQLINLSKHQRSQIPLTVELSDALILSDKIKNKHEALRRHVRFMAKVLSNTDLEPIQQALDVMANKHQQKTAEFHFYENLRDQLLSQDNNQIEQLIAENEGLERQKLRQLIRMAVKEKKADKPPKYYRELFHYLKQHVSY